jgi:hypothetical protein
VDTVIEGKITPEEGLGDVLQTIIDLKDVPKAILRITSEESDLQGRIAFAQGGYILGGKVNNTDETGYPAVRKLLAIRTGNYAILDPGRQYMSDINQTLWINAARIIDLLPQLPESPEVLLEANMDTLHPNAGKPGFDPLDLKISHDHSDSKAVAATSSKARQFDLGNWRALRMIFMLVIVLVLAGGIVKYWDQIIAMFQH